MLNRNSEKEAQKKEQPARGRLGWPKGRARPWAAEANRRRWQSDPGYRRLHRSWSRDCHLFTSAMVAVPPCFSTTTAIAIIYRSDRNKLIPISACRSFIDILTRPAVPMNNSRVLPDSPQPARGTRVVNAQTKRNKGAPGDAVDQMQHAGACMTF
jgi:hypothetical protein